MKIKLLIVVISLCLYSILNAKPIVIGVRPYHPPFEMLIGPNKQFTGFEVDIMREICKRLKMECSFIRVEFKDLFSELQSNKITLALGAMIITKERQKKYLFSLPYLASKGEFTTGVATSSKHINGICDKKIGLVKGSIYKDVIFEKCGTSAHIIEYSSVLNVYYALSNHAIAALLTDFDVTKYWVSNNDTLFKSLGSPIPIGMGYAIMANFSESKLIKRINEALIDMENDGTYLNIYREYVQPLQVTH